MADPVDAGTVASVDDLTFENLGGGGEARAAGRPQRPNEPTSPCARIAALSLHRPASVRVAPALATADAAAGGGTPVAGCAEPTVPIEETPIAGTEIPGSPVVPATTETPSPTATATETPTATATPLRNRTVKESFDAAGADGLPLGWRADPGSAQNALVEAENGELVVTGAGAVRLVREGRIFNAPDVRTRLRFDRPGGRAGVLLAWTDPDNWIAAVADEEADQLLLWEAVDGQVRQVFATAPGSVSIESGQEYWLRAQAGSDADKTWVTLLWSTDGRRFRSVGYGEGLANLAGAVGLATDGVAQIAFDDFAARRSAATQPGAAPTMLTPTPSSSATADEPDALEPAGTPTLPEPTDSPTPPVKAIIEPTATPTEEPAPEPTATESRTDTPTPGPEDDPEGESTPAGEPSL